MKIWVDDIRPAPDGYVWCKSVNEAKNIICETLSAFRQSCEKGNPDESLYIDLISLDHDSGSYFEDGGDYIRLLDWLEWLYQGKETHTLFHLHTQNPVGRENMRRIIEKNGWKEVK